jgi:hypothetical protein
MLFRFIGQYTHGRNTINMGVLFEGREPSFVEDAELARRLANNLEFEMVEAHPLDHDGDGEKGGSLPKKRGRPKKVAE